MRTKSLLILMTILPAFTMSVFAQPVKKSEIQIPLVWATYKRVATIEEDFANLKANGVGLVNISARDVNEAREKLRLAREFGMKYHIGLPDITEHANTVRSLGFEPVDALMIGGVYQGRAVDRHLYKFKAGKNIIIIEPPVYNKSYAYTENSSATGYALEGERIAHYFPDIPDPVKAEIIVPLKRFDGQQHLRIIEAKISLAPDGSKPEEDSVTPDMPASLETKNRKLYQISFDLTGLDKALLDQVGVAIYWPYNGTRKYWIFGGGNVSAAATSTHQALQKAVKNELAKWTEANDGKFPTDVVVAARFGDECFYITGHSQTEGSAAVNYPLWDFSDPTIQAFRKHAGAVEYPRTWGFPEIYGKETYGWWMYNLHEQMANLAGVARAEIALSAPGLHLFRNTTRMGVFDISNLMDGSGQELLTQNLDIVHLDPYPVSGSNYGTSIPRDMSYCAGLARRYDRLLIPWMQAHVYSKLSHVSPEQVDRMSQEQWEQGVDGIMWLGYGYTFPEVNRESWKRAAFFHQRLATSLPPKPIAKLAVLRSYNSMATTSLWENGVLRNPTDWLLQQFLEVWSVDRKEAYDVFEVPPVLNSEQLNKLMMELKNYTHIVSTIPWKGAWVIDAKQTGTTIDRGKAKEWQQNFKTLIDEKGW